MDKIEIIPAIDIIEGKCVRLTQGKYESKKIYNENPLLVAKEFESYGIKRLHIVDLDGAKSKHIVNYSVVEKIANATSLTIDFGGGIKTDNDLDIAFKAGASMVTIGSVAVSQPELFIKWLNTFGTGKIILGADVKNGLISINGWKEEGDYTLDAFLKKYVGEGVSQVLCTDISKDGMLSGPATELYKRVLKGFPDLKLIASGGISCIDDILTLQKEGIPAVVFGKAIYEGKINIQELIERINSMC